MPKYLAIIDTDEQLLENSEHQGFTIDAFFCVGAIESREQFEQAWTAGGRAIEQNIEFKEDMVRLCHLMLSKFVDAGFLSADGRLNLDQYDIKSFLIFVRKELSVLSKYLEEKEYLETIEANQLSDRKTEIKRLMKKLEGGVELKFLNDELNQITEKLNKTSYTSFAKTMTNLINNGIGGFMTVKKLDSDFRKSESKEINFSIVDFWQSLEPASKILLKHFSHALQDNEKIMQVVNNLTNAQP